MAEESFPSDQDIETGGNGQPVQNVVKGMTPDITAAQIISLLTGAIGLAVAFALVDQAVAQKLIAAFAIIVPATVTLADGLIRHGRSRSMAPPNVIHIHTADVTPASLAAQDDVR